MQSKIFRSSWTSMRVVLYLAGILCLLLLIPAAAVLAADPAPTTTSLSSTSASPVFGQSVTFTATVTGEGGTPAGSVTFKDGTNALGSNDLNSSGVATLTISALAVGAHSITADFVSTNTTFANSSSTALTPTVSKASTTTALISSDASSGLGDSVTFTATVSVVAPGTGTPAGTVTFLNGTTTLGTGTLSSGHATLSTDELSLGTHTITARYEGNGNYNTSTSTGVTQIVAESPTIKTTVMRTGMVGLSYSQTLAATGGTAPYTWARSGTMPTGLSLSTAGKISGTPTKAIESTFEVTVKDANSNTDTIELKIVIRNPGYLYLWGDNATYQLGNNSTTLKNVPAQPSTLVNKNVVTGATSGSHSLAVTSSGVVYAWGSNSKGQLGDGTTTTRKTPVEIDSIDNIIAVAAGSQHSLALDKDGNVYAWGNNSSGQLGINSYSASHTPVQVEGVNGTGYLTDIVAIAAGSNYSLALKSDGTVYAWGDNDNGGDSEIPIQIKGVGGSGYLTNIVAIAVGNNTATSSTHALALKSDGTVYAWGANASGQLGNNTNTSSSNPVVVSSLDDAVAIAAGSAHSLAIESNGSLYAWGKNSNSQLGNNSTTDRKIPTAVSSISDVIIVAAGGSHSLAANSSGDVYAWGYNNSGQLGIGSTTTKSTPQLVGSFDNTAIFITGSGNDSMAISSAQLTIDQVTITTESIADGIVGTAYSQTLAATGGSESYTWSKSSGTLPPGISINSSTGKLTGTPTTAGDYTFTIKAVDSENTSSSDTASFTVTIEPAEEEVSITTSSLSDGTVGTAYSKTLAATGGSGSYTWTKSSGNLPPGLSIGSSTGKLTGTPTTAGDYTFTIKAADANNASDYDTASFTMTIKSNVTETTVSTTGLQSDSAVKVDNNGNSKSDYHLSTADGKLSLDIPAGVKLLGANSQPITSLTAAVVNANITPPTGTSIISGYSMGPDGANFSTALTLTFTYQDDSIPANVAENSLYIATYAGGQWTKLSSAVDTDVNTVSTQISHFSNYLLLGKASAPETSPTPTGTKPTPTQTGQVTPTGQQPTPTGQGEPDKTFNWWIVIVIIAVVLVILVILLIRSRRRKYGIY